MADGSGPSNWISTAADTAARWVIIRTEDRRELFVYRRVIDLVQDIWLPLEPRMTRDPEARNQRQWWRRVLPGYFFAKGNVERLWHQLPAIPLCGGMVQGMDLEFITLPDATVEAFRARLEAANREAARMMARTPNRPPKGFVVRREPSRKLKARRIAKELRNYVKGLAV